MLDEVPPGVFRLKRVLPQFPDGRIDYSGSSEALVLDCYVLREGELLILRRANPIAGSSSHWHVVSGYLDDECTVRQKVVEELSEETGVTQICSMQATDPYMHVDVKTWTVYPVAVRIAAGTDIRLNEEHTEFAWIHPVEIGNYLLPQVCAAFTKLMT